MQVNAILSATSIGGKKINTTISHLRQSQEDKASTLAQALNALTTNTYVGTQINEINIIPGQQGKAEAKFEYLSPATIASGSGITIKATYETDYAYTGDIPSYSTGSGTWNKMTIIGQSTGELTAKATYTGAYPLRISAAIPETNNYDSLYIIKQVQNNGEVVNI